MSDVELDGELISEEDVETAQADSVRALPRKYDSSKDLVPALRSEMTAAAIAAAGGVLAGAVTVAAVRAVTGSGPSKHRARKLAKRGKPANVVASRSFLVDVHVLGR
ncbi:MAG: hypothetical protein JJE13_06780 [Thermoleophilia bacterium]|nr:hypothetical protein [Thermoleophilia bacterium]